VVNRATRGNIIFVELVDRCVLKVQYSEVIVIGGAEACPLLNIGDPVLVRVRSSLGPHRVNGVCDFYIPGTTSSLPDGMKPNSVAYSVLVFNRKVVSCPRRWLIRISETKYLESCEYIKGMAASLSSDSCSNNFLSNSSPPSINSQESCLRDSDYFAESNEKRHVNVSFPPMSGNDSTSCTVQCCKNSREFSHECYGGKICGLRDVETNTDSEDLSLDGHISSQYVLARWPLTGYYYRAVIKQCIGEQLYEVTDTNNELAVNIQLHRTREADIIFDIQEPKKMKLEVGKPVLASMHPRQDCIIPGVVKGESRDGIFYYVQFYDKLKVSVPYLDVFSMDHERYHSDVEYLKKVSTECVGCTVIARKSEDGVFSQGSCDNASFEAYVTTCVVFSCAFNRENYGTTRVG